MNEMNKQLRDTIAQLIGKGKMVFSESATKEQISEFEKAHGITLPAQYREWLQISDGCMLLLPAGVQLYGIAHKPIINVDEKDRPDDSYIVIGALSTGDPVVYQKNSDRISIFNHEEGRIEDDESYTDFCAFLNDLCNLLGIGE